jgi:predicted Zn-dependent peptidase
MARRVILAGIALAAHLFAASGVAAGATTDDAIVTHPSQLTFKDVKYQPPRPDAYRHTLKCGVTAYVAENHEVPTFEVSVLVRTGSMYEPLAKAGLADMTGYVMRNGGVEGMTGKELDERLAFLAGDVSVRIGEDEGRARLFCLAKDMDEGLALLRRVLRDPVFDAAVLDRYRADVLSGLEQRNAETSRIEEREWAFLMCGNHPCTTAMRRTGASVGAITREDLIAFHQKYFFPKNFILAVSGDFKTADVLKKLDALLADWPNHDLALPPIPDQIPDPTPGVYVIPKPDVNQSRIRVGHLGVKRDIPEQYALMVMNEILGGGGFSSRMMRRVRSDEGLAYNVGSRFDRPVLYPGTFRAWFQTKHATAAFGTRLIVDEINRIRTEPCDEEAIATAKAGFIGEMVNPFSSRNSTVNTFAEDDYTDRPDAYWQEYAQHIEAVTAQDVQAAAQKFLHPDRLVYLVIGDPAAIAAGSDKHPERFTDFGPVTTLPLRDPVTLEIE